MPPQIENPRNLALPNQIDLVLSRMFADYRQVIIRKRFGNSLSGGCVIEVRPIRTDGKAELPTIAKLAAISLIQKEWQAYQQYIRNRLPETAEVIGDPVLLPEIGWGGLRYSLHGYGTVAVVSLHEYCLRPDVTVENIRVILTRLFKIMHEIWGEQRTDPEFHVHHSYDRLLPVNLLVQTTATPPTSEPKIVNPSIRSKQLLEPGDWVRLAEFKITKVDLVNNTVTLNRPEKATNNPYYVRLKSEANAIEHLAAYEIDQIIEPITGEVLETRTSRLHQEIQQALGKSFAPTQSMIALSGKAKLENPVTAIPNLLNKTAHVKLATIHGDFNLENILIEPETGTVSLIDFAEARDDHILHDCFRLETEVITKLISDLLQQHNLPVVETLTALYWRLHRTVFQDSSTHLPTLHPSLEKPLAMLTAIRQTARKYFFNFDNHYEYYQGLTLYLLGALKFRNLNVASSYPISKQTPYWAAVLAYQFLIAPSTTNNLSPHPLGSILEQYQPPLPLGTGEAEPGLPSKKSQQKIIDLVGAEQTFRQRVRERYVEDAGYYVPLAAQTREMPGAKNKVSASRSARRRRHRPEYAEWVRTEQQIELIKVKNLKNAVSKFSTFVLLGDPGAGKTTALEHLAYQFTAEGDEPHPLPILLRLSEFTSDLTIEEFIIEGWGGSPEANHWGAPELATHLDEYLEAGRLLFLFDALNEMPREGYGERVLALRRFIDRWGSKGNRFVVSCRILDYGEALGGLQRVEIQPLSDQQIFHFLLNELDTEAEGLWDILSEGRSQSTEKETIIYRASRAKTDQRSLWEMARNPYLLTMMIDIFTEDRQLGQNRADLMSRFTQILMSWAREKCPPDQWLDADIQREALSILAFETQRRSGFGTLVKTEQVKAVMPDQIQLDPYWPPVPSPPEQILSLAASANIIEMPADHSSVRFYHQLLQEYFAARQMLKENPTDLIQFWEWPWLEVEMPPVPINDVLDTALPPPPPTGWEETTILAVSLSIENNRRLIGTLLDVNPILAGRCLYETQVKVDATIQQAVIDRLLTTIGRPEVALRVRIAAGQVLGDLGDPRLGEMVTVPAGPFIMGNDQGPADQKPQHKCLLPTYQFGKYPVTNSEFRRFVEAGGYRDKGWWTSQGWARKKSENWSKPRYWSGHFSQPNRPVIGVSWYECVAYCHWLSAETGQTYRLPTEAEWEKAARGLDGSLYPWGDSYDPNQLNSKEGEQIVMATTPVGVYPTGVSPFGAFDCAGNVWEWCSTQALHSRLKPYLYDPTVDEWAQTYLTGQSTRVLRGGSWYGEAALARCPTRFSSPPEEWFLNRGFRLVRVLD